MEQTWEFDNRKRISHITITNPNDTQNPHADMSYTLNGSGDILFINQNEYRYDGFDRIVFASTLIPGRKDYRDLIRHSYGTVNGMDPFEDVPCPKW